MWWKPIDFRDGQWYGWRLSGAEIFVCRQGRYWQACYKAQRWDRRSGPGQETPAYAGSPAEPPGCLPGRPLGLTENPGGGGSVQGCLPGCPADWKTNSAAWNGETASLRPCFPEKPFLVSLGGVKLFPGMNIKQDLELPPVFNLTAENGGAEPEVIFTFFPFELKETWYGRNTMEGRFCYSLPAGQPRDESGTDAGSGENAGPENSIAPQAEESPQADTVPQAVIHCTMVVRNQTKTVLAPGQIPLYTGELAIYEQNGKLVCDTPAIDALGDGFRMTVTARKNGGTPGSDGTPGSIGTLVAPGCKNDARLIRQRTRIIKNITGF
jgi:hypothetical protein